MIKRAESIEILNICKQLNEKVIKKGLSSVYEKNLYSSFDRLYNVALDLLNIPTDTANEYNYTDGEYYCRDAYYEIITDYVFNHNDYNEEEIIDMLMTLNE